MTNGLVVKIILPFKLLLEAKASLVNIPGSAGVFGVMSGHEKFTSSIDVGIMTLFLEKKKTEYFIYGGVAQIQDSVINVVTEFAVDVTQYKRASVNSDISNLRSKIADLDKGSLEYETMFEQIKKYETLLTFI